MKTLALLSQGLHPVSGKPCLPRLEAQAVRLAAGFGPVVGLHAGPSGEIVGEALGRGLAEMRHLKIPGGADPVPALVAELRRLAPDLIVAGRRAQGGEDTGLLPYVVAQALGFTLVADALAVETTPEGLCVTQARPKGARRLMVVRLPALVTVHPNAPPPWPYALGRARAGARVEVAADAPQRVPDESETRPYRARPKTLAAPGAQAAKGRLLVDPDPQEAAREILTYLREIGAGPA